MAEPEFTTEELSTEEWRPVVGYEGFYEVSNLGRVKRVKQCRGARAGNILKRHTDLRGGYLFVMLSTKHKLSPRKVHQLVAHAFFGPCPAGYEVGHADTKPKNNRKSNLSYLTHAENQAQVTYRRGSDHPQAKLSDKDVLSIRHTYSEGVLSQRKLAERYHVSQSLIGMIINHKTWTHI